MFSVMVVGAGRIGASIAKLLHNTGDYSVTLADRDQDALERTASSIRVVRLEVESTPEHLTNELRDSRRERTLRQRARRGRFGYFVRRYAVYRARGARSRRFLFDLTEDVETTRHVHAIAARAAEGQIFMPQCGLAPGFIGILAASMVSSFDRVDAIRMRVGALPEYPHNHLMYHLTWSTDGMINEYCKPCDVIHRGRRQEVLALDGLERFAIDGVEYEAFNTSGGLGTLCETLEGKRERAEL